MKTTTKEVEAEVIGASEDIDDFLSKYPDDIGGAVECWAQNPRGSGKICGAPPTHVFMFDVPWSLLRDGFREISILCDRHVKANEKVLVKCGYKFEKRALP